MHNTNAVCGRSEGLHLSRFGVSLIRVGLIDCVTFPGSDSVS